MGTRLSYISYRNAASNDLSLLTPDHEVDDADMSRKNYSSNACDDILNCLDDLEDGSRYANIVYIWQ